MQFVTDYNIKRIVISPYNTKANGMIERDYKPVINVLAKMIKGGIDKWVRNLHVIL
jgi:transposase InsO family protein